MPPAPRSASAAVAGQRVPGFSCDLAVNLAALGSVGSQTARIWLRSPHVEPLRLGLEWQGQRREYEVCSGYSAEQAAAQDHTQSITFPADVPGAEALEPQTRYLLILTFSDGEQIELPFETAPAGSQAPTTEGRAQSQEAFAIAVISCHQPFDEQGKPTRAATEFLKRLPDAFERRGVKRVLLMGDQIYSDCPATRSLFDPEYFEQVALGGATNIFECSRAEVRKLYQDRHRLFFSSAGFRELQQRFPCYPILDDHEILDNFGSAEAHHSSRYQDLRGGALDAYVDYQASRLDIAGVREQRGYHFEFDYGPVAGFVMDLRSHKRNVGGKIQIYDSRQFHQLEAFLARNRETPLLLLGLSVPLVHIPDWMVGAAALMLGEGSDAADRWSYAKAHGARDQLFELLCTHQAAARNQKLVLVGGDVHVGVVGSIAISQRAEQPGSETPSAKTSASPMYQLVSSAVSNLESPVKTWAASLLPLMKRGLSVASDDSRFASRFDLLAGVGGAHLNPVPQLNAGLIRCNYTAGELEVRLQLLAPGSAGEVREVFTSEPLT